MAAEFKALVSPASEELLHVKKHGRAVVITRSAWQGEKTPREFSSYGGVLLKAPKLLSLHLAMTARQLLHKIIRINFAKVLKAACP